MSDIALSIWSDYTPSYLETGWSSHGVWGCPQIATVGFDLKSQRDSYFFQRWLLVASWPPCCLNDPGLFDAAQAWHQLSLTPNSNFSSGCHWSHQTLVWNLQVSALVRETEQTSCLSQMTFKKHPEMGRLRPTPSRLWLAAVGVAIALLFSNFLWHELVLLFKHEKLLFNSSYWKTITNICLQFLLLVEVRTQPPLSPTT